MAHQKQDSNASALTSYEVKEEGEPHLLYCHKLEPRMAAPGTVIVEECQFGNFKHYLVPQPSSDPLDPLNWPSWLKHSCLCVASFFVFLGTYTSSGFSSLLLAYAEFLQIPVSQVQLLKKPQRSCFGSLQLRLGTFGPSFFLEAPHHPPCPYHALRCFYLGRVCCHLRDSPRRTYPSRTRRRCRGSSWAYNCR